MGSRRYSRQARTLQRVIKPDMQSQTNIHNVFLFTTINNSITIIEMNDDLY